MKHYIVGLKTDSLLIFPNSSVDVVFHPKSDSKIVMVVWVTRLLVLTNELRELAASRFRPMQPGLTPPETQQLHLRCHLGLDCIQAHLSTSLFAQSVFLSDFAADTPGEKAALLAESRPTRHSGGHGIKPLALYLL